MKTTHTPGPWKIEETSANSAFVDVVGEDGWLVAEIEPNNPDAEANGHLIAAAPELLEACRKARTCASLPDSINDILKSAITKATGGNP